MTSRLPYANAVGDRRTAATRTETVGLNIGQFLQSSKPCQHGRAGNSFRSTMTPQLAVSRDTAPSGNVAFPVRQRLLLLRIGYLAGAALQAAIFGHLLNFSSEPRISRPCAALPQKRSKRASSVAQGLPSRSRLCLDIADFRE